MKARTMVAGVALLAVGFWGPAEAGDWWKQAQSKANSLEEVSFDRDGHDAYMVNWVDEYIEVMAGATVDDKRAVNQAHAVSMAKKTARHLAYEKLAETISGIRLTSDARYDRELMLDANLNTKVQALIRGAVVVSENVSNYPDGSIWAEVVLGIHLKGDAGIGGPVTSWIIDTANRKGYYVEEIADQPVDVEGDATVQQTAAQDASEVGENGSSEEPAPTRGVPTIPDYRGHFSGLIIDARGLGGRPAVVPKILTQSGEVFYGPAVVDEEEAAKRGLVSYASSIEEAKALDRIGRDPLVLKATAVAGDENADVVISDDAAALIYATIREKSIFRRCRVAIVLD